jgi:hypothetical protein
MAPALLEDKPISRRTLGHDMESFFAVIIWIASLEYGDEDRFLAKPLAKEVLDKKKTPMGIVHAKVYWFNDEERFYESIVVHFDQTYLDDDKFVDCLFNLRGILYPVAKFDLKARRHGGLGKNDNKVTEDPDPMKERLFWQCMEEIDAYFGETNGCDELKEIDRRKAAEGTDGEGT